MTISLSNLTINNNVVSGTLVGVLTAYDASGQSVNCSFSLTKGSVGLFAVTGNKLVTAWSGSIQAGSYSMRVNAVGSSVRFSTKATFEIQVKVPAAPPPPPPPALSPDGSQISPPSGSPILTKDGSWSFGPLDT